MSYGPTAVVPTPPLLASRHHGRRAQDRVVVMPARPLVRGLRSRVDPLVIGLLRLWARLQVSRSGRYSPARFAQFQQYAAHASPLRCLLLCLIAPMASMLFVVLLECMPLAPPRLWQSDAKIWLRMTITTTTMGFSYVLQFKQVIPELPISTRRAAAIGVTASLLYVALLALLSWLWTFPIPFGFVVTAAPYTLFLVLALVAHVGVTPLRTIPQLRPKARQLIHVLLVQSMLVYVYPVYTAIFVWLGASHQPMFLLFLPAIKLVAKNLIARACADTALEDQLPEITVFSVELFNSLYLTACVSIAGSVQQSMAVIVVVDVIQLLLHVRAVLARAQRMTTKATTQHIRDLTVLSQRSEVSRRTDGSGNGNGNGDAELHATGPPLKTNLDSDLQSITQKLHFSCEYLVLVEYIETFIPAIVMLYTAILEQLPNAKFYPEVRSQSRDAMRTARATIALYVGFKLLSLLFMGVLLKHKLQVHALVQLAFVLETQMAVIQAKLFVWVTYSLTFRLEHSGMDFAVITAFLGE